MTKIAILGAGISGLAHGFYLKKHYPNSELKIFEQNARVGGILETITHQGDLFELGARGLRPSGKGHFVLEFIKEIGLWDEVVCANAKANKRFVYLDGCLREVPMNFLSALFSPVAKGMFGAIYRDFRARSNGFVDESVANFVIRHFGVKARDNIFDPLVSGMCAGDIDKISMRALFPHLAHLEQKYGSLIKAWLKRPKTNGSYPKVADAGIISFRKGMSGFAEKVASHLINHLQLSTKITRLEKTGKSYAIYFLDGSYDEADVVINTLPSYVLANILTDFDHELVTLLKSIDYAPVAVVSLGFINQVNPYAGFGYLIPHKENQEILGAYWNDKTFPEFSGTYQSSFTVLLGGVRFKGFHALSESDFMQQATENLKRHLKIKRDPDFQTCKILPYALPQYTIGHASRVETILKKSPQNLFIRGNFIGGAGIADIIRHAKVTCESIREV